MKKRNVIIGVYNESDRGWEVKETNDPNTSVIQYKCNGKSKDRYVRIGIQKKSCRYNILRSYIQKEKNSDKLNPLFGDSINVGFSKKTLEPYIRPSIKDNNKSIIFGNISIDKKKLISTKMVDSQLIDYGFDNKENMLNLIISLNSKKSFCTLYLYDTRIKKIIVYNFTSKDGRVYMDKYIKNRSNKDKIEKYRPHKYRPHFPTQSILVYKKSVNELRKVLKSSEKFDISAHKIEIMDRKEVEVLNKLKNGGVRAVTIFNIDKEELKMNNLDLDIFKVIFDLNNEGKITQLKV